MKNLHIFLWLFTTAIASYFAYHTYSHTRIRYKDLESVMMQNLGLEKSIIRRRLDIQKQINDYKKDVEENYSQGLHNLEEANSIQKYSNSLKIDSLAFIETTDNLVNKASFSTQNINLLNRYGVQFANFVADKVCNEILLSTSILREPDTSNVAYLREMPFFPLTDETHYLPILQQQSLQIRKAFIRTTHKGIDDFARVGILVCRLEKLMVEAFPKSKTVKVGKKYEAYMVLIGSSRGTKVKSMRSTEGSVNVKGDVGEIEIKNVKAQNYNSEGKATKTLTGKVTIKKADGSDTTFTLSTNYVVKKKL